MNANELKGQIVANGYNIQSFCETCGFVRSTFDRKLNGTSDFTRDEVERIMTTLGLTWDQTRNIFFAKEVTCKT